MNHYLIVLMFFVQLHCVYCYPFRSWDQLLALQVLKDRDALNKVWYSAKVSSLKDGEALVHYTKLQFDVGK